MSKLENVFFVYVARLVLLKIWHLVSGEIVLQHAALKPSYHVTPPVHLQDNTLNKNCMRPTHQASHAHRGL
jgi:hypothetical protein